MYNIINVRVELFQEITQPFDPKLCNTLYIIVNHMHVSTIVVTFTKRIEDVILNSFILNSYLAPN